MSRVTEESQKITDNIVRLYTVEGKSLKEIADIYGMTKQGVNSRLERAGVELRPVKKDLSKEVLIQYYVDEEKSIAEIGKLLKCDAQTVRRYLDIHQIPIRSAAEVSKNSKTRRVPITYEDLKRLYIDENKSQKEIGEIYGYSQTRVAVLIREAGLSKGKGNHGKNISND